MADPPADTVSIRSISAEDLAALAQLGLDEATALRAMATQMGWLVVDSAHPTIPLAACTARLADGAVLIDALVGAPEHQRFLIDHVVAYGRWSDAPAVLVMETEATGPLEDRGFVGLAAAALPTVAAYGDPDRMRMRRL